MQFWDLYWFGPNPKWTSRNGPSWTWHDVNRETKLSQFTQFSITFEKTPHWSTLILTLLTHRTETCVFKREGLSVLRLEVESWLLSCICSRHREREDLMIHDLSYFIKHPVPLSLPASVLENKPSASYTDNTLSLCFSFFLSPSINCWLTRDSR